jgi:hypothetical protein
MRISTMRLVDRWLGIPVCVALTVLRRVRDRGRAPAPAPPRRIVFVKLAEQGSTVLACSAIRRAVELVGREHVFFVVFEQNRFILDVMALIPPGNVVTIDANGALATVAGAVAALRRLRRLRVDVAIDLEFFARSSAAIAYLSGATSRVGLHAFGCSVPTQRTIGGPGWPQGSFRGAGAAVGNPTGRWSSARHRRADTSWASARAPVDGLSSSRSRTGRTAAAEALTPRSGARGG